MSILGRLLYEPFWEELGLVHKMAEHGDPDTMSPDEYAKYHPGVMPGVEHKPRVDRLRDSGMFTEHSPFDDLPQYVRNDLADGVEHLTEMGFTKTVEETGVLDWSNPDVQRLRLDKVPMGGTRRRIENGAFRIEINPFADPATNTYSMSRSFGDLFRHEYGHVMFGSLPKEDRLKVILDLRTWHAIAGRDGVMRALSTYAVDADDDRELYAEAFARVTRPDYEMGTHEWDKGLLDMLRRNGLLKS